MNFGDYFLKLIKSLFNSPRAQITTNGVLSDAFSLSRGCRQGCPASPALFSIAIEPLAIAIRSDAFITGIKSGTQEHKLALYADDLLVFISQPTTSFPSLFTCLRKYSIVSGYKIHFSKSEAFPIKMTNQQMSSVQVPFKWWALNTWVSVFLTHMRGSLNKNYVCLLTKCKTDLQRWMDLPLSLTGRINTIKMNLLPKFISLFRCIPLKIPISFFKDLDKSITSFLWKKKSGESNSSHCRHLIVKVG